MGPVLSSLFVVRALRSSTASSRVVPANGPALPLPLPAGAPVHPPRPPSLLGQPGPTCRFLSAFLCLCHFLFFVCFSGLTLYVHDLSCINTGRCAPGVYPSLKSLYPRPLPPPRPASLPMFCFSFVYPPKAAAAAIDLADDSDKDGDLESNDDNDDDFESPGRNRTNKRGGGASGGGGRASKSAANNNSAASRRRGSGKSEAPAAPKRAAGAGRGPSARGAGRARVSYKEDEGDSSEVCMGCWNVVLP